MKKLFLLATALFMAGVLHAAGKFGSSPESSAGYPLSPEYGGFSYSTSAFTVNGATITGGVDILGVFFSSGATTDYVDIYTATSTTGGLLQASGALIYRLYNVANSTGGLATSAGNIGAGFSPVTSPGRGSLHNAPVTIWFVNNALHNLVTLLYNKE